MRYRTPAGTVQKLYLDALEQAHLLIAGQTGSGKSVVLNGIIQAALHSAPCEKQFILIDPKRVELVDYRDFPHTITYASEPADMIKARPSAARAEPVDIFLPTSQEIQHHAHAHRRRHCIRSRILYHHYSIA